MSHPPNRKQIAIFLPVSDWRLIRLEAARRRQPITVVCREWMEPAIKHLRRRSADILEAARDPR